MSYRIVETRAQAGNEHAAKITLMQQLCKVNYDINS